MGLLDSSAGHPSYTSSFSWLSFSLLMGSGKHISMQGAPVEAAASLLWRSRQRTPVLCLPMGAPPESVSHQTFGMCNVREAKHLASVSSLSLTQHIAVGTWPLRRTSGGVEDAMQGAGKW